MMIIGGMCLHFLKMSCVISKMLYLFLFCQIEHESYLKKQKKKEARFIFRLYGMLESGRAILCKQEICCITRRKWIREVFAVTDACWREKKWNVEDIGVVHWNDILLLLVGCFGHQCAIGGIMMIWGCHMLANV